MKHMNLVFYKNTKKTSSGILTVKTLHSYNYKNFILYEYCIFVLFIYNNENILVIMLYLKYVK